MRHHDLLGQHQAYLRQARSDYRLFRALSKGTVPGTPACHTVHHLQMSIEKLTKAMTIAQGKDLKRTHLFLKQLLYMMKRDDLAEVFGLPGREVYSRWLKGVISLAWEVERLQPALAEDGPNFEYPWLSRGDTGSPAWIAPADADDSFLVLDKIREDPHGPRLLFLIERLLERFDTLFA